MLEQYFDCLKFMQILLRDLDYLLEYVEVVSDVLWNFVQGRSKGQEYGSLLLEVEFMGVLGMVNRVEV